MCSPADSIVRGMSHLSETMQNYEIITLENVIYKNGEGKIENPYEVEDI